MIPENFEIVWVGETMEGLCDMTLRDKVTGLEVRGQDRSRWVLKQSLAMDLQKKIEREKEDGDYR
jgi:hypothetical protein